MLSPKKIIVTGGHLTPALAVIEKLRKQDWQILFIGRKHAFEGDPTLSVEYRVIKDLRIPFLSLTTGRLQRSFTRYTILSLLKIPIGIVQSFYWVAKYKPDLILSFGGYLALPVALAGWLLRVPVITHEQSVIPGLATKIIACFAKKVCVSWFQTQEYFSKEKVVLTGNPIREEIFSQISDTEIKISDEKLPLIYITGGSLGAHAINQVVVEILPKLLEKYRIIHQCGDSQSYEDYEKLSSFIYHLSSAARKRYFLTKYVGSEDIGWVLNHADLVVSRAGANIITELAALGLPAILIPLPWAGQKEQAENARLLERVGTAIILSQEELTGQNLSQYIESLIKNIEKYKENAKKAQELVDLKAADKLIEVVKEVIHEAEKPKNTS